MGSKIKIVLIFVLALIFLLITGCINSNGTEKEKDHETTKVSYRGFGALETVGGSLHQLSVGANNYVIDAGSFYGDEGDNFPIPSGLDVHNIDGIFITHAHADHIGRLPLLLIEGYRGPIYMTSVTKDITLISTLSNLRYLDLGIEKFYYSKNNKSDSKPVYLDRFNYGKYQVQAHNKVYIELKRSELEENGFYLAGSTLDHLKAEMQTMLENQIVVVDFEEEVNLSEKVSAQFFYTSHLPGSAMIYFTVGDKNILFSGDIGSDNSPFLLENSRFELPIDYLFVEGTYGTKVDNIDTDVERQNFINYIGSAIERNERVIIPAFAIDRSQQALYEIRNGMMQGVIPKDTKVKVFSPTIEEIINLYEAYSLDKDTYSDFFSKDMFSDIFNINNLEINPRIYDSMLYDLDITHGEIAVMTSGMISSGFSKEILIKYINDPYTNFISVSYQDPDEVGGRVFYGDEMITIDGVDYKREAKIYSSPAFSGHANVEQIYDIFQMQMPKQIMIVHLNEEDKGNLIEYYSKQFEETKVFVPMLKEQYPLFEY